MLGGCAPNSPKQPQPGPHLVCGAAGDPRALLGGQRVADVLEGLLSGGGQWSGGTGTHRAGVFISQQHDPTQQTSVSWPPPRRSGTTLVSGDTHFRKNSASFQIKSRSSLFCVKVLPKYSFLIPIFPFFTEFVSKVKFSYCVHNSQKWRLIIKHEGCVKLYHMKCLFCVLLGIICIPKCIKHEPTLL